MKPQNFAFSENTTKLLLVPPRLPSVFYVLICPFCSHVSTTLVLTPSVPPCPVFYLTGLAAMVSVESLQPNNPHLAPTFFFLLSRQKKEIMKEKKGSHKEHGHKKNTQASFLFLHLSLLSQHPALSAHAAGTNRSSACNRFS